VPDETTILRLRHLLEEHDLTKAIFDAELREEPDAEPGSGDAPASFINIAAVCGAGTSNL
jgi:hypothetical protein